MTQLASETIECILAAAAQRNGGDVSIVDIVSLASLYNKAYTDISSLSATQSDCIANTAAVRTPAPSAMVEPEEEEEEEEETTVSLDGVMKERMPEAFNAASPCPLLMSLVRDVLVTASSALTDLVMVFVTMLTLVHTTVLAAIHGAYEYDGDREQEHHDSNDEVAVFKMMQFLVNLLRTKASERAALQDIATAYARHAAAQASFKATLAQWPAISVDQETSPHVLGMYADVSVAVDAVLTTAEANAGGNCEVFQSDVAHDDPNAWV